MSRYRFPLFKNIISALFAIVFLACAAEVGLRYYDSQTGMITEQATVGLSYLSPSPDRYCKLQSLTTYQVKHPDTNKISSLVINSFGLRNKEVAVPKPANVLRVICLGDERTLAAETTVEKTYCHQLQQLLQSRTRLKVEVVNAGVPHSCPLLSFLQLRQSLLGLQPDLVVLNFDMTDIADDHNVRRHLVMGRDKLPLACRHPSLQKLNRKKSNRNASPFLLVDWGKSQLKNMQSPSGETRDLQDIDSPQGRYAWIRDQSPDWSIYTKQALEPIKLMNDLTEGSYARLLVAVAPAPWQVSAKACQNKKLCQQNGIEKGKYYRSRVPFETLANQTVQKGILFCDASPYFLQQSNPEKLFLQNDVHLSPAGHQLYARVLASFIVAKIPGVWLNKTPASPQYRSQKRQEMATRPHYKQQQ